MKYASELNQRILRDMDDCVIALDHRGHIMYMNPQFQSLLGLQDDVLGKTYAEVFFDRQDTCNDAFHQFLVDAVLEKERTHTREQCLLPTHRITPDISGSLPPS